MPSILFRNGLIFRAQASELTPEALDTSRHNYADASAVQGRFADCMLVEDGKLVNAGLETSVSAEKAVQGAEVVDLGGKLVVPGFIDGHSHVLMFGQSLDKVDLTSCTNLEDIQHKIRQAATDKPDAPRILASGWLQDMTDNLALSKWIDDVVPHKPVYIEAKDLHSHWCNTKALQELGITNATPDPEGGEILRDESGNATGLLAEMANINIVWPSLAKLASEAEQEDSFSRACDAYLQSGYTGVVEMALDELALACILRVKEKRGGSLPIRLAAHWLIRPMGSDEKNIAQVKVAQELMSKHNDEFFRVVGIKLVCDGVIDGCTAALKEPYFNGTNADPIWPYDVLVPVVQYADSVGLQVALHAIGDQAVHNAVEAIASLGARLESQGLSVRSRRHRIEHLELTDAKDIEKLGRLGITASIQPVHSDPAILRGWCKMLGDPFNEGRCSRAFAYREFFESGAPIALGSDAPTALHWVLPNLYNAVTRRSARQPSSEERTTPKFALPLAVALAAASYGAAYSCKADGWSGTLEAGKSADFVVIDTDLFSQHADSGDGEKTLLKAKILQTWIQGRKMYDRDA
ncbi:hypothetical protein BCV70DRAFT_24387 [Testicularia cyperi]|uniref:Amidohydrolase 3 domain-containing protein n=1 Tax=Testicularia cyperi TaxID=1882483 RepID=A0A317Y195_9BASI|nr:hypothetical protein BCV70DRAFT_24387 [Testicularia cyperi]